METLVNFEAYISRMASMSDKVKILDLLPEEGLILDYGCGGGPLAHYISPERYIGYDIAPEMVKRALEEHPHHRFTDDLTQVEQVSAVVFSSLLHEVYSYHGYSFEAVEEVLVAAREKLQPGGRMVIRDGVQPPGGETPWSLPLRCESDTREFLAHLQSTAPQSFPVTVAEGHLWGTKSAIINFLNVYTWGWASVEREKEERVNFATLEKWRELLSSAGLHLRKELLVSQEDYFQHLEELVALEGKRWETKVFLVAEAF